MKGRWHREPSSIFSFGDPFNHFNDDHAITWSCRYSSCWTACQSAYIGGVAVGSLIFSTLYWLFGFLRVSTSAFAAQANGAQNEEQGVLAFLRPFC